MSNEAEYLITFVRHGQSTANAEKLIQGQQDFPLNDAGRAQAQHLAAQWKAQGVIYDLCIASPLLRALETAQILAAALQVPIETDPLWMERHAGNLQGVSVYDPRANLNAPHPYARVGETGESEVALHARGAQAVQSLLDRPSGRYLVVSHGAILNRAIASVMGIAPLPNFQGFGFAFGNTAYAVLQYRPAEHKWRLLHFESPTGNAWKKVD